jgi:hypothetical protein
MRTVYVVVLLVVVVLLQLLGFGWQFFRPAVPPVAPVPPIEPQPPVTPPPAEPNALAAIVRISRPGVGCSATVIGPRRPDNRWWVLTACHCTDKTGERWQMKFRDGRSGGFTIVSRNPRADVAWGVTDANDVSYPFAFVAEKSPEVGARVWHAGFGVDIPGNREEGQVLATPDQGDQIRFRLSVSSGDSGGGIVIDRDGKICSTVCCTTRRGAVADVWGASVEAIRAAQRDQVDVDQWIPLEIPERMPPKP